MLRFLLSIWLARQALIARARAETLARINRERDNAIPFPGFEHPEQ
tara:strand:- start:271 stop:408 length:138 start_codon:yes stop_codon:yes gene_type:complete